MTYRVSTIINPKLRSISTVRHITSEDGYSWINRLIGSSIFTFVRLYENGDGVYLDDEGLFAENQHFWIHKNYPTPLAGIGVFIGIDNRGDICPPNISNKEFSTHIEFIGNANDLKLQMRKANIIDEDYRSAFFEGDKYA
tara:strand:+ start:5591 stop:6010 length:420 start_codon:yes stop_codon:yes gene_type:complete